LPLHARSRYRAAAGHGPPGLPGANWELAKIRHNLQRLVQASDFDFHVQLCKVQGSYCDAVNEGDRGMA